MDVKHTQTYHQQTVKFVLYYSVIIVMFCVCFSLNVALWPVWSFFTPVILFTQFMGVVMLISLLG